MTRPIPRSHASALATLAARCNPRPPVAFALDEAPRGYLAEAVPSRPGEAGNAPSPRVAAVSGYAVGPEATVGAVVEVQGTITRSQRLGPHGEPPARDPGGPRGADGVQRVETGAILPPGSDRVVPADAATIVGAARVRLDRIPPPLGGTAPGWELPPGPEPGAPLAPAGACLDERLRATLRGHGVTEVVLVPSFAVGIGIVGSELAGAGEAAGGRVRDATGPFLEEGIAALGLRPLSLGLVGDSPDELRDAILHVRERTPILLLAGGLGDGLTDRTAEGIRRFEAYLGIEQVALAGARHLLHAKTLGIDIIAIGGLPLEAACGFDLFVRPALLSLLGAPRERWDWTQEMQHPLELGPGGGLGDGAAAWPACRVPSPAGLRIRLLERRSPFFPWVPEQEGWAVVDPAVAGDPPRCHFVAAAGHGRPADPPP